MTIEFNPRRPIPESTGSRILSSIGPIKFLVPEFIADFLLREDDKYMEMLVEYMRNKHVFETSHEPETDKT